MRPVGAGGRSFGMLFWAPARRDEAKSAGESHHQQVHLSSLS